MNDTSSMHAESDAFLADHQRILGEIQKQIVGQDRVVDCVVTAILCGGNVLLEGVPGLGKTELVKTLSRVLDLDFKRIQFTPDLMPADIVGTNVLTTDAKGVSQLEFRKGPIFTQMLLADEINRATPKTQSALLETMQEGTVTISGATMRLDQPFFVLATQNPIEQEGTYPLPEAQLDRFLFKVTVPFLNRQGLNEVLDRTVLEAAVELAKIVDGKRILAMREVAEQVVVASPIRDYAVRLVLGTHPESEFASDDVKRYVRWGASPRAAQALLRAARVRALSQGRAHVSHDDVDSYAVEVLQHRVLLNYDGQAENLSPSQMCRSLIEATVREA